MVGYKSHILWKNQSHVPNHQPVFIYVHKNTQIEVSESAENGVQLSPDLRPAGRFLDKELSQPT